MIEKQKTLIKSVNWSTLIVLDACRFDVFQKEVRKTGLKKILKKVDSENKHTGDFFKHNWSENYPDIILVGSHPRAWEEETQKYSDNFFKAIPVFKKDDWLNPNLALMKSVQVQLIHPGKKVLIHLVPPHLPYIGKKGKEFLEELGVPQQGSVRVYKKVQEYGRKHGWEKPRECYRESVRVVLDSIENHVSELKDKVVITSDHGELLGEDGIYNHNMDREEIRMVPWCEVF